MLIFVEMINILKKITVTLYFLIFVVSLSQAVDLVDMDIQVRQDRLISLGKTEFPNEKKSVRLETYLYDQKLKIYSENKVFVLAVCRAYEAIGLLIPDEFEIWLQDEQFEIIVTCNEQTYPLANHALNLNINEHFAYMYRSPKKKTVFIMYNPEVWIKKGGDYPNYSINADKTAVDIKKIRNENLTAYFVHELIHDFRIRKSIALEDMVYEEYEVLQIEREILKKMHISRRTQTRLSTRLNKLMKKNTLGGTIKVVINVGFAPYHIISDRYDYKSGNSYSDTFANRLPGTYKVVFSDTKGYITPPPREFILKEGETVTINGEYVKKE